MAQGDEALQVIIRPFNRDAAHGDILPQMLAALGQNNAESPAGNFRICEKQLVEIPHPIEKQAIGIGRFNLHILRHHRGQALGLRCACFGEGSFMGHDGGETSKSSAAVHQGWRDRLGTNLVKLSKNIIIALSLSAAKVEDLAQNETKLRPRQ